MSHILCMANQKGGVGKTTTSVNLAASLASAGRRVLLVDMDPQGNATMGSGVRKNDLQQTIYQVLLGQVATDSVLLRGLDCHYDLLPANRNLAGAEVELVDQDGREQRLRKALLPLRAGYEYIILDCPPALNLLTVNALCAADQVIIPMQCEYYALEGLSDLVQTIRRVKKRLNPDLVIGGLLRTMFDARNSLAQQVSRQLEEHFGTKVFDTVIPRNVRLAEAPSFGRPALFHDQGSKGAQAYLSLAGEMNRRNEMVA